MDRGQWQLTEARTWSRWIRDGGRCDDKDGNKAEGATTDILEGKSQEAETRSCWASQTVSDGSCECVTPAVGTDSGGGDRC